MKDTIEKQHSNTLRKEYDFNKLKEGISGKYSKEFKKHNNIILLEPEVAKFFPTSKDVNSALKLFIKIASNSQSN